MEKNNETLKEFIKNAEAVWNRLELWKYTGDCNLGFDQAVISQRQPGDVFVEPFSGMAFVWVPGRCFQSDTGICRLI
ncbi:MAG: hypothetical protein CSA50_00025 [Gammaproteobacteria bacterium]|nr:MAG: hypothetical protein CSA50_00025 [Gammaproteobacteria bacterium]